MVFVTLCSVMEIIILLIRASAVTDMSAYQEMQRLFLESARSYVFWKNELLPKIAVILLFFFLFFGKSSIASLIKK
jgi:hypothetical protein